MPVMLSRETEGRTPVGGHDVTVDVRCDYCGEPVAPGDDGVVGWEPNEQRRYLDLHFLHGRCVEGLREREGLDLEQMDLGRFFVALRHNLEAAR